MSDTSNERNYIVGIYLSESDAQPRFRHVYSDMKSARQHIGRWLSEGYIHVIDIDKQDHFAPSQIYKVRIMSVTKIITQPNSAEANEVGVIDEQAYWVDELGAKIDCRTVPL